MSRKKIALVDIDDTSTWPRYKSGMCNDCVANCCRMPVEATMDDLIRMEVVTPFEAGEKMRRVVRKLKKEGIIEGYNPSRVMFTLARRPNSDCIFLDPQSRRCTIYEKRPDICRNHPQIGPRPNHCPYQQK